MQENGKKTILDLILNRVPTLGCSGAQICWNLSENAQGSIRKIEENKVPSEFPYLASFMKYKHRKILVCSASHTQPQLSMAYCTIAN